MMVGVSLDHAERIGQHLGVPCRYVYNGVDTTNFYKPDPSVARGSRLLFVGRYTPEKGVMDAILLAKKLRMGLDLYGDLEIVSDMGYAQRCFAEADGRLIRAQGPISREETVKCYQKAAALVFPVAWNEPFGLVIPEANATGCPVVVLNRGAMPELIEHGKSGFLCRNINGMEEVLRNELAKTIKSEDCIAQAQKFSIEKFVDNWEDLIKRVKDGERW